MKTQTELQVIFNTLTSSLKETICYAIDYTAARDEIACPQRTPLQYYLSLIRNELTVTDAEELLFISIYDAAFHTGPTPYLKNYMALAFNALVSDKLNRPDLTLGDEMRAMNRLLTTHATSQFPKLTVWIDMDKIIELVKAHFKINPSLLFTINYASGTCARKAIGNLLYESKLTVHVINPHITSLVTAFGLFSTTDTTNKRPKTLDDICKDYFADIQNISALAHSDTTCSAPRRQPI